MFFIIFCLLCAGGFITLGCLTFWPISYWWQFYQPIILFLVGFLIGVFFSWWIAALMGLFVNQKKEFKKPDAWSRFWFKEGLTFIDTFANINKRRIGFDKIPRQQKYLLVCNHRSKFDSMLISQYLWKDDIAFIMKESNMKIPLGHKFMHGLCYLPITREDKIKDLKQMKKAENLLVDNICSIGVFPEGTRHSDILLGDFHEGVFNIAIHSKCPLVIMTSKNTETIHKCFPFKRSKIVQEVLCVLYEDDYSNMTAKALSDLVHQMMENNLKKYYKEYEK